MAQKAYKSWEIIQNLAATRQQIITEKLRAWMISDFKGQFNATDAMIKRMQELAVEAQKIIDKDGPDAKMTMAKDSKGAGGATLQAQTVLESTQAALGGELKSYEGWKKFANTYFRDLKEGQQLGHEDLAVSTAKVAVYLKNMDSDDPLRPKLRAYYAALQKVDAITEETFSDTLTIEEVLDQVTNIATKTNLSANITRDVDSAKGKVGTVLQYSYEPTYLNKAKGNLSKALLKEVTKLFEGPDASGVYTDVISKNKINVSMLSGSKPLIEEVKDAVKNTALRKKQTKVKKKDTQKKKFTKKDPVKDIRKKVQQQKRRLKQLGNTVKNVRPNASKADGAPAPLLSLVGLINAKLPQTVVKNMGPPGLENQTGRFASSVKVTDVMRTAQGHPSIGYTYQKNPYQVFEMTQGDPRWATPERDPRKLIDASIREIAAQLAIGRFYTRRL